MVLSKPELVAGRLVAATLPTEGEYPFSIAVGYFPENGGGDSNWNLSVIPSFPISSAKSCSISGSSGSLVSINIAFKPPAVILNNPVDDFTAIFLGSWLYVTHHGGISPYAIGYNQKEFNWI